MFMVTLIGWCFFTSPTDITLRDAMTRALEHAPEMKRLQSDTERTRAQDGRVFMVFSPRFDFTR
jgi:hypothetical protein